MPNHLNILISLINKSCRWPYDFTNGGPGKAVIFAIKFQSFIARCLTALFVEQTHGWKHQHNSWSKLSESLLNNRHKWIHILAHTAAPKDGVKENYPHPKGPGPCKRTKAWVIWLEDNNRMREWNRGHESKTQSSFNWPSSTNKLERHSVTISQWNSS